MNHIPKLTAMLTGASLLASICCASAQYAGIARKLETVDTIPAEPVKGYVEFTTVSKDAVVPIYLMDEQRRAHLLGATGIMAGDAYWPKRYHTKVVGETLRVAVPPGTHTFMIEKDGEMARVPVEAGKVTPVEVDYTTIHQGLTGVVYRQSHQVFPPGPMKETPKKR